MARDGWFDGKGLELNNSTVRARRDEWARILADGKISSDERMRLRQEIYRRLQSHPFSGTNKGAAQTKHQLGRFSIR